MKTIKWILGVVLLLALVAVVQLADPPQDSPTTQFQRLPDIGLRAVAEAEWAAGRPDGALLLLDYVIENDLPDKIQATAARQKVFAQMAADTTPATKLKATGWAGVIAGGNSFESLAGSTVADSALYGEIAQLARQGAFDAPDELGTTLNKLAPMATVFPPAEGAITLTKAALRGGAINESLARQLRQMLTLMQTDPKGALAVEKFKENVMPLFELAKRCRTWGEFHTILLQADSPDQLKVLTKMVSVTPAAPKRLSQILTIATREGRPTATACLDFILRQGPKGLDALYGAMGKGPKGLKFVTDNPGVPVPATSRGGKPPATGLRWAQEQYQALRYEYGAGVSALKYLAIAILSGLLVLVVVPGRYLEKLLTRPGSAVPAPGPAHYLLSGLAVGAILSGMAYLLSLAVRPTVELTQLSAVAEASGAVVAGQRSDSAFLSGTVVLISLAIHAVVWFFVRSKIRQVEDDEAESATLRLKRLENLDVFLDLPLFTGLALTVIAFILITLDAGMSRHFAYTSTVVGILSAVSLRIRYLYPLKERLIQIR